MTKYGIYSWHNSAGQPCSMCGKIATYGEGVQEPAEAIKPNMTAEVCVDCAALAILKALGKVVD